MPDIQIEETSKFKKLSKENRDDLAEKISSWWLDFHKKRQEQLNYASEISDRVYLHQKNRNKTKEWKSNIKENKLYATAIATKSALWRDTWSDPNQMFDVTGITEEDEEVATKQKEALTHTLRKMQSGSQFDKATEYWITYGDFVFKTDWKSRKKKVKRYDPFQGMIEIELPLEENANIEAIDPMFFNFDTSKYKYGDKASWDSCPKIYKRFATIDEIKSNPLYKLTREQIAELDIDDDMEVVDRKTDEELATTVKYGERYEVLYLQGDIKFNNIQYKNIVAEVFAGKYLIYFEENPIYINPFVFGCTEYDEISGRGISPLKCILEMCKAKEELINKANDISTLNSNPPTWANDTFLKEKYRNGKIEYEPGVVLEYENSYDGKAPQQVKFDASGMGDIINVLANDISDASGVNANAMGNVEQGKRLATDLQLAQRGADSRTAMRLDKIYQINLEVIKNVAELEAMFHLEPEKLLVKEKGQRVAIEITNAIRQGNYNYIYEDRNAVIDRNAKVQQAIQMFSQAANNPELFKAIDWVEVLKTGVETIGFDNPDKFFKNATPITQMADLINQLPENLQMAVAQQIQPVVQQAMMIAQQGGQNEEGTQELTR